MYSKNPLRIIFLALLLQSCHNIKTDLKSYFGFDIPKDTINSHLQDQMEMFNIPGMSITFINDGKVVHQNTFGFSNLKERIPVSNKTIFEAASLSKPIFAYFVMKYVEEGMLTLDTPLYTYLSYPDIAYDERYKKITARMVLSHRTGFPNWRSDLPDNKLSIAFDPGTDYLYSGEGYQYLAKVIKHLEGATWEELDAKFRSKVAIPLGMEHTVFIQDSYSKRNKAEPYDENGKWISPDVDIDRISRFQFIAAASLHSESLDFSKWLIALMNKKGLEQKSFEELFKVHSHVGEFNSVKVDYTLGFFKAHIPLTNIYLHGGNNNGFTSYFAIDPDKGWGFVLFTNSEYGGKLGEELIPYLLIGPDLTKLYIILGAIILIIILGLFFIIRFVRKRRNNQMFV